MTAAHTPARDPRNWRTEHALMQATIDARRELARATARIAPPPTGSREIPRWLLAVLLVATAFVIATFAPPARAAMDCQAPADFVLSNYDRYTFWPTCGYWYDDASYVPPVELPPILPPIAEPPVVTPHTPAVPEPASWLMFAAGLVVSIAAARRRSARKGQP